MRDYILLMHNDSLNAAIANDAAMWERYFNVLQQSGCFDGGSEIGDGQSFRKTSEPAAICRQLNGYLRIRADSLAQAQSFLHGNPIYEANGTVEIRELPRD